MNYQVKALGYRTDFIFNLLDGSVTDRGEYLVAITDSNPHYFWGNLLLFKVPPAKGDFSKWKDLFKMEFPNPETFHITLAWDSPDGERGEIDEFLEDGFKLEKSIVLVADSIEKNSKFNEKIFVREVDLHSDMQEVVDIQVACADEHLSKSAWRSFYDASMANYLKLIQNGHGKWFGAYIEDTLVGTLGIFQDGHVGRFQIVSTDPQFQRRGVCSTLVYEAANYAFNQMNVESLVMVADEGYHAAKIYESVGFMPTEYQIGLCWWDESKV